MLYFQEKTNKYRYNLKGDMLGKQSLYDFKTVHNGTISVHLW